MNNKIGISYDVLISNENASLIVAATIPVSAIGAFFASKKRNAIYAINFYMTLVEIVMLVLFLLGIAVV